MLDPQDRRHLFETLRPPPGYRLDFAMGTTFSLDLLALLITPVAFTFFDWDVTNDGGRLTADPLALLEALRRNADRIAIFCEAGRIAVPDDSQLLFTYLEDTVFETAAPRGGSFHPKIWLLRFVDEQARPAHRLLCLSRNLTFDRCWDTVLALDGVFDPTAASDQVTAPLIAFLDALPGMVVRRNVPQQVHERIALFHSELQHVRFEAPAGFQRITFHPMGITNTSSWPFGSGYDRLLVISPFVTANCLGRMRKMASRSLLIARLEELQALAPDHLRGFETILTLSPSAQPEEGADQDDALPHMGTLTGLHAKLYVAEHGDTAHIWTGSANATDAAFMTNVEFVTELVGPRRLCGIKAILGEDYELGLRALLEPFVLDDTSESIDTSQAALDDLVDQTRRSIARLALCAVVTLGSMLDLFTIELQLANDQVITLDPRISVSCWPITVKSISHADSIHTRSPIIRFLDLSFDALTSFFAFHISARQDNQHAQTSFVLHLPLVGAPANRRERVLRSLLQNREQVLRFLLLLLSDDGTELAGFVQAARILRTNSGTQAVAGIFGLPLFEAMVRALERDPEKLDYIARLIDDLRTTLEGQQLLPEAFDAIWAPIRDAREELRS